MLPGRAGLYAVTSLLLLALVPGRIEGQPLRRLVERGRHPAIRWGRFSDVQAAAVALYQQSGWRPLWLSGNRPTAEARALMDQLATAGDRGLDPEDYDARQLAAFSAMLDRRGADQEQAVRFDAALTVAALRFTTALARGRAIHLADGPTRERFDPIPPVSAIRGGANADSVLNSLEPAGSSFGELKRVLGRYRRFAKDSAARRPLFLGRIRQIELALERWRWLPREGGPRAMILHAPAGRIQFLDRDGASVWLRAGPSGSRCRNRQAFWGGFWMVAFRPAELPGTALAISLENGILVAADGGSGGNAGGGAGRAAAVEEPCLRVGDGELLAELLLRGREDWTVERVRRALSASRQQFVRLARPVQVQYVYTTVMLESGQVTFLSDEYGHDRRLDAALRRGYPYQ